MTEPPGPAAPVRTWRPMVLWTAGILLLLGLVWFVGAVVVPVWQIRSWASVKFAEHGDVDLIAGGMAYADAVAEETDIISVDVWDLKEPMLRRLGGPEAAARKLTLYYRLPQWIAPHKCVAIRVLACCGEHALPTMVAALRDPDPRIRSTAITAITLIRGPEEKERLPFLEGMLSDPDPRVHRLVPDAIARIRGEEPPARRDLYDLGFAYNHPFRPILTRKWLAVVGVKVSYTWDSKPDSAGGHRVLGEAKVEKTFFQDRERCVAKGWYLGKSRLRSDGFEDLKGGELVIVFISDSEKGAFIAPNMGGSCQIGIKVSDWNDPIVAAVEAVCRADDRRKALDDAKVAEAWRRFDKAGVATLSIPEP
jgi:hypothetical protein